jgi:hypothetical protein
MAPSGPDLPFIARLWSSSPAGSGIAQKLTKAGETQDLSAVMNVIESAGEEFDRGAVEAALMQVERCVEGMSAEQLQDKVHKTKTFQMLADMAVSTAADAPPDVLARTIGVCGRLGCDQIVLDSLARHLITGVDKLQPEQMQQLVEGLNRADHSPGVLLLDAIQERLQGLGSEVQQQQADSIKEGLRGLGHEEVHTPNPPPQEQTERIKYT